MREKITVTYEIPAPNELWEYVTVRRVTNGEAYFDGIKWCVWEFTVESDRVYPVAILRQQWRPATEADVGRTDARFRDTHGEHWIHGKLIHVFSICTERYAVVPDCNVLMVERYCYCEVPAEPTK